MPRGTLHAVAHRVRGYKVVSVQTDWEPALPFFLLRLTYRHPESGDERRFEFRIPVDQEPTPRVAFPFLMQQLRFVDHSGSGWEGREIEIQFSGDYPWPIYADSVRELP
jgi:hypothetical protein